MVSGPVVGRQRGAAFFTQAAVGGRPHLGGDRTALGPGQPRPGSGDVLPPEGDGIEQFGADGRAHRPTVGGSARPAPSEAADAFWPSPLAGEVTPGRSPGGMGGAHGVGVGGAYPLQSRLRRASSPAGGERLTVVGWSGGFVVRDDRTVVRRSRSRLLTRSGLPPLRGKLPRGGAPVGWGVLTGLVLVALTPFSPGCAGPAPPQGGSA